MVAPVLHRKWAREYLTRAQHAGSHTRKCQYLQLAISNTVYARKLEGQEEDPNNETKEGSAHRRPAPKN